MISVRFGRGELALVLYFVGISARLGAEKDIVVIVGSHLGLEEWLNV